ncbi:MAG: hypothetical protein H6Q17_803 [Bacteroidetes bacterium]|nr:hypothetical protein [Bacteroidota bacterium]
MKRILVILTCSCLFLGNLHAEEDYHEADQRTWHYGFTLGMNSYGFAVTPRNPQLVGAQVSSFTPGFTVGIIGDLRLNNFFNLRFTPSLNFTQRTILYRDLTTGTHWPDQPVQSTFITLPLYLKYRSVWYYRTRPYLIAGGGIDCDLQRGKDVNVYLKTYSPFIAFGIGCDIYFDFFRLSPEFKFCLGMNNVLTPLSSRNTSDFTSEQRRYTDVISRLTSKAFVLTFNFE